MPTITAARVVTPSGVIAPGAVELDGNRVAHVTPTTGTAPDVTLAPGFVDIQLNGFDDVDVADASGSDWDRLDTILVRHGVTSWCPTLITQPLEAYEPALARIADAAARGGTRPHILGAHLEGPFLGGAPGAHDRELIVAIDDAFIAALSPNVRLMTLAPEQANAIDAIRALESHDVVVALGHSNATLEQATAAIDAGARLVTHCFNGMAPFHHRAPGLVGAALTDDRVAVSLIADLQHVHAAGVRLVFNAKPRGRVVLVSDAVAWSRTGTHLADGTMVGATVGLDTAVRNAVMHAGVDIVDAVNAASTAPADLLGVHDRGRIEVGARADLVALDEDLHVHQTWIGGVSC